MDATIQNGIALNPKSILTKVDTTPTADSNNPVSSDGVKTYVDQKDQATNIRVDTLNTQIAASFFFKGSSTFAELPASGNTVNDTYYVTDSDKECWYSWNGTDWIKSSMSQADYAGLIAQLKADISAEYSTSKTYKVGDYCLYGADGVLYICKIAVTTAGAFDSNKWQAISFGEAVGDLVIADDTQPTSLANKIWLDTDPNLDTVEVITEEDLGNIVAGEFNSASAYAVGDYCIHDAKLYVAKTATSVNDGWIAARWQQVTVMGTINDQVGELKTQLNNNLFVINGENGLNPLNEPFNIDGSNKWVRDTAKHICLPINSGDIINITGNPEQVTTYGFLTDNAYQQGAVAAFSAESGYTARITLNAGANSGNITAPIDAKYLYFATYNYQGTSLFPASIKINGVEQTYNIRKTIDDILQEMNRVVKKYLALDATDTISISANDDFDNYTTPGNFRVSSVAIARTIANIPIASGGRLFVLSTIGSSLILQFYIASNSEGSAFARFLNSAGTWGIWHKYTLDFNAFETSANLLPEESQRGSIANGITYTYSNGILKLRGTAGANFAHSQPLTPEFSLNAGTYTLSISYGDARILNVYVLDSNTSAILAHASNVSEEVLFTVDTNTTCVISVNLSNGSTYNYDVNIQVENGNKQTEFHEPSWQSAKDYNARERYNILRAFSNLICVGDSLTYGAVYTDGNNYRQAYKNYPTILGNIVGADVTTFASPGYSAIQWWNDYNDDIIAKNNGLALVYLGTNGGLTDTLENDAPQNTSPDTWATTNTGSYAKIVQKFINSGYKIILIKCYYTSGDIDTTNKVIAEIADRFKCGLIENEYMGNISLHIAPDGINANRIHYNDLGYAAFADQIINNVYNMSETYKKYLIHS